MSWITTRTVIAFVKDIHTGWDWTYCLLERNAMRPLILKLSVSLVIYSLRPYPAAISVFTEAEPERISKLQLS